jgi:hypothetical protein
MGSFVAGKRHRWLNRTVPYQISEELTVPEHNVVRDAIRIWNASTVVRLVERSGESDYVEFVRGNDCASAVGRQGGRQVVTCSFEVDSTVVHEIAHAVGLWHEQSRQDRNLFIQVHSENIEPEQEHNFQMHIDDGHDIGPYDYQSLMHYSPGQRAVDWRPGSVIERQSSKAPPAVVSYGNRLHMVHLGESSNDIWWSIFDGVLWRTPSGEPGNEKIPGQKSKATPALAVFNNHLHMVHLGDSSNDIWWSIYDGVSWNKSDGTPGNERIPGQKSKASPALAVFNNQLHMVHLGDSSNDIWWSIYDGVSWNKLDGMPGNERIPGQKSKASPALAVFNSQLHMVHLGDSSNDIWWSIYDGGSWNKPDGTPGNERIPGQKSKTAPDLKLFNGALHLVHLGKTSNNIWTSTYRGNKWSSNRRSYNGKSRAGPTLAALGARLYMFHVGETSERIYQTLYDPSQVVLVAPAGISIGTTSALSPGDIQTVAEAYSWPM